MAAPFVPDHSRVALFSALYERHLRIVVEAYPAEYVYGLAGVERVAGRMRAAFERGSFNHDGRAIKATCKELDIPYRRRAILAYLSGVAVSTIR